MKGSITKILGIIVLVLFFISCSSDSSSKTTLPIITTNKKIYLEKQAIVVEFNNMLGHEHDWLGIYPLGVNSDWGNQLQWAWTEGKINGQKTFTALPIGEYEARAFFNNSKIVEATQTFKVSSKYNPQIETILTLNKDVYLENELISIIYRNMQGNTNDWIGLFSLDSNTLIDSKETKENVNGQLFLGGLDTFPDTKNNSGGLKAGNYAIKAFFNGSQKAEKTVSFTVIKKEVTSTIYESGNNNISPNWIHISGPTAPYFDQGMVNLTANWVSPTNNTSEYRLVFPQANTTQKVLELDAGGLKYSFHFYIGVILETTYGSRKMIWDPFFTHGGVEAFKSGSYFSYPLYVDIQEESEQRHHVRVDVEKYLKMLEPNNNVISISAFMASGGDLDEIKLSSH